MIKVCLKIGVSLVNMRRIHITRSTKGIATENDYYSTTSAFITINQMIKGILGDVKHPDNQMGMVFVGGKGAICIDALVNPSVNGVFNVPMDQRDLSKEILMESFDRPSLSGRVHLLCNAGYVGSGKSVLQSFNLQWFVESRKGIAFDLTFSDDQAAMWKCSEAKSYDDLMKALVVRIIHRLIERYKGTAVANSKLAIGSPLLNAILDLGCSVEAAIVLVRRVLGVKDDTEIMLGVDDLSSVGMRVKDNCKISGLSFG